MTIDKYSMRKGQFWYPLEELITVLRGDIFLESFNTLAKQQYRNQGREITQIQTHQRQERLRRRKIREINREIRKEKIKDKKKNH